MAITDNSKIIILPEDFQDKRSNIPGAQILTIGELRNLFVKPFNWNDFYSAALTGGDASSALSHNATFGDFINANFAGVTIPADVQMALVLTNNSNISGADFTSAVFSSHYSNFEGCKMDGVIFDSVTIPITLLSLSSLIGSSFASSNIGDGATVVAVYGCDLTSANFADVFFDPYVTFTGCKMDGINLKGAVIDQTGANGPNYFIDCTGLPDTPVGMGFTFGTGFLYWPATATYFNESFEELFCKTQVVDGVKFAGQNLVNKVFGFYNAGVMEPTSLRNCDFNNTTITMALNPEYVLFDNCNFQGSLGLMGAPADNSIEGENNGSIIRWIDGKLYSWSTGTSSWTRQ